MHSTLTTVYGFTVIYPVKNVISWSRLSRYGNDGVLHLQTNKMVNLDMLVVSWHGIESVSFSTVYFLLRLLYGFEF